MARPFDQTESETRVREGDRSLGELLSELSQETETLVREEIALAKAELSQKASQAGRDVGFLAAGGAVAYAGFLALIAALILGLGQLGLTWWVSALVVGIVIAAIGGYLVWKGIDDLRQGSVMPQETIKSVQEDVTWTKQQI